MTCGDIQRQPENFRVGFAEVNEAGGNEGIGKSVQLELVDPVGISSRPSLLTTTIFKP